MLALKNLPMAMRMVTVGINIKINRYERPGFIISLIGNNIGYVRLDIAYEDATLEINDAFQIP